VFEEAVKDEKWRITMDKEIVSIEKNDTWKLISRKKKEEVNRCQVDLQKKKKKAKGEMKRYKERLVEKRL
jgi:hypothetical protein